jgi:hypothetical protein
VVANHREQIADRLRVLHRYAVLNELGDVLLRFEVDVLDRSSTGGGDLGRCLRQRQGAWTRQA